MSNTTKSKEEIKKQEAERKAEENRQTENALSGIVDQERRIYTFKKVYNMYGKKLQGTFEAKYLSIVDRLRIGTIRARLLDGVSGQSLDRISDDISYMLAYLNVALTKAPKWWDYEMMSMENDIDKLREVFNEVANFNRSFRYEDEGSGHAQSGSDQSGEENMESM